MYTSFALEIAIGHIALDEHRAGLDACLISLFIGKDLKAVSGPLGIALIHPVKHLGPILRFGSAGSWMNLQDGIGMVIVVGKQDIDLEFLEALHGLFIFIAHQIKKLRIIVLLQLIQLFLQRNDVSFVDAILVSERLQRIVFLDDVLGLLLIIPEAISCLNAFKLFYLSI